MHKRDPEEINAATRPESRYETRDLDLPTLVKSGFWFFVGSVALILLVIPYYFWSVRAAGGPPSKQDQRVAVPSGNNPPLQSNVTAKMDIVDLRHKENQALNTYGWVDRNARMARIPIERAIKITAQRGLNDKGQTQ